MNFLDSITSSSGLKSSKPSIEKSFFPLVADKYITVNTENHQSKQWDHFQEFINLVKPSLVKEGIKIVELGWNDITTQNIDHVIKNIDPKNAAYILERSLAHVGVESFLTQLSSFYKVPLISLYSNTSKTFCPPLWGEKGLSTLIESHRKGALPTYAGEENPKTINFISPEEVAGKCLDALGIENDMSSRIPFHMGAACHSTCVEVVPNFIPDDSFFPRSLVNVRLDYFFNTDSLIPLGSNRKLSLISNKEIDLNLLAKLQPSLEALCFKVNENFHYDYFVNLKKLSIPLAIFAQPSANISATRLKFFDFKVEEDVKNTKKNIDNSDKICDNSCFKSSKMLFSNAKQYSTKASWENDIPTSKDEKIIDSASFWEESQHLKLYNIYDKQDEK